MTEVDLHVTREAIALAERRQLTKHGLPTQPPQEVLPADQAARGEYVHTVPNPLTTKGYRTGRTSARRRRSNG